MTVRKFFNTKVVVLILAMTIPMALYTLTVPHDVTFEDSGEFIAASWTLGIVHPPGYPMYCLWSNTASHMLGSGTVGWRVNFGSAILASVAIACFAGILMNLIRPVLALIFAIIVALSLNFWDQAIIADVYSMNLLFITLLTWLMFVLHKRSGALAATALVAGLALANHQSVALLAPGMLFFAWPQLKRRGWPYLAVLGAFGLLGMAVFLYLPVRSSSGTVMDWGFTRFAWRFIRHVTRFQYSLGKMTGSLVPHTIAMQLGVYTRLLLSQVHPAVFMLVPLGAVGLWRSHRRFLPALAMFWITAGPIFVWMLNFRDCPKDRFIHRVMFVPSYLPLYILAAFGAEMLLTYMASALRRRKMLDWALAAFALVIFVIGTAGKIIENYRKVDLSRHLAAVDHGRNIMHSLPENAWMFILGDGVSFPLTYFRLVDGLRTDLRLLDRMGYQFEDLYDYRHVNHLAMAPSQLIEHKSKCEKKLLKTRKGHPVYFSFLDEKYKNMKVDGIIYSLLDPDPMMTDQWLRDTYILRNADDPPGSHDFHTRYNLARYPLTHAENLFKRGLMQEGLASLHRAERRAGDNDMILGTLAGIAMENGLFNEGERLLRRVLSINPWSHNTRIGLCSLLRQSGRTAQARDLMLQGLKLDPEAAPLLATYGLELYRADKKRKAKPYLHKALKLLPRDPAILDALGEMALDDGRLSRAMKLYKRAVHYAPDQGNLYIGLAATQAKTGHVAQAHKNIRQALTLYKKALKANPDNAGLHISISQIYRATGNMPKALHHLKEADRIMKEAGYASRP